MSPSATPPQDLDAEAATIGAMLTNQRCADLVLASGLRAEDFFREQHRKIYAAIGRLRAQGRPADGLTVAAELDSAGDLAEVGGADAVHALAATCPAPANAPHYAGIVRDQARERAKQAIGAELRDGLSPAAAIERLRALEPTVKDDHLARSVDGATFGLDAAEAVAPAIWGTDDAAWASGEPLMIAGPQGVGKTTLAQQLALHRAGIRGGELLGMPVEVDAGRVLYIAADRPQQAARSLHRMVREADRQPLADSLVIWRGPLEFDVGRAEPGQLAEFVGRFSEVGTVIMDSLKDVAVKLSDDEVGSRVNTEHQRLIAADYELVLLHHQRKASGDNRKPRALDDVYGSTWLTSGTGSVLLLWGKAGDPIVDLHHLKQPAGEVGPLTLMHDHQRGEITLHQPGSVMSLLKASSAGVTVRDVAIQLYGTTEPDRNQKEKARRKLDAHPEARRLDDSNPVRYVLIERSRA